MVPVPSSNAARSACPPTLLLTGERQPEQQHSRPVGGQARLGLFGCGGFTGRPLRRFQALAEEQVRLRPLSRRSWEQASPVEEVDPEPAAPKPTTAMLLAAEASDMREAFPTFFDEEAAECGFAANCPADPALAQD